MSRTIRRDGYDTKYSEGQDRYSYARRYNCRCSYCTGVDRKKTTEDTFDKILEEELEEYYSGTLTEGRILRFQSTS